MKEKKIDRHSIINELTNSSLKNRYEIEKLSDDKLTELYNETIHSYEIHYPNGNDFI